MRKAGESGLLPYFEVGKTDQEKNKSTAKKMKQAKFKFSDTKFRLEDVLVETSSFITRLQKQIWFTIILCSYCYHKKMLYIM